MTCDASVHSLSPPRQRALPWLVVGVWLIGSLCALGFFELSFPQASVGDELTFFDADTHSREAETWLRTQIAVGGNIGAARATVVHVFRDGCACNPSTDAHLQRIAARYGDKGVRFVRASTQLPPWVTATPAALVFDGGGRLVYFGPLSDAAWCGAAGSFVERTLDQVLEGRALRPQPMFARTCRCGSEQSRSKRYTS